MGISHLITLLHPYGKLATLGGNVKLQAPSLTCKQTKVIIDGPSLTYHVYYRLLAHRSSDAIDALPSYHEIGRAFRAFLNLLQDHGVVM